MELSVIFLQTGTNLGNKHQNLLKANELIVQLIGEIVAQSKIYETEAWGITNQPTFYNQVLKVETHLAPLQVLLRIQDIEEQLGRVRKEKWGERIIDIDILFYDEQVVREKDLIIPHPEIQNRNFVLIPMLEIASDWMHPLLGKTIEELYIASEDRLEVIQLDEE